MAYLFSFFVDFMKVYLLIFFLFSYHRKRKARNVIITCASFFSLLIYFGQFYSNIDKYLSTISLLLIFGIIIFQIANLKKSGEILVIIFGLTLVDMIFTGAVFPFILDKSLDTLLKNDFFLFLSNSISLMLIIIAVVTKNVFFTKKNVKPLNFSLMELQAILVCTASCIFLFALSVRRNTVDFDTKILFIVSIVFFILFSSLIYFIWNNRLNKRISIMQTSFNEQQRKYNEEILDKYSEKRKFQHDITNHLLCIGELSRLKKYDELEEYVSSIRLQYKKTKLAVQTNNYIVDVIANDLLNKYADKDILLEWNGRFHNSMDFEDPDLSSLFSNLLRNAFEATELVEKGKKIHVDVKYLGDNLVVQLSNPCLPEMYYSDSGLLLTNKNSEYHGFGCAIIENIVSKYSGQIEYSINGDLFKVNMLFIK